MKRKKNYTSLSDSDRESMDIQLLRCYRCCEEVSITYYDKGKMKVICDRIVRIDLIDKAIVLPNQKKILFSNIIQFKESK